MTTSTGPIYAQRLDKSKARALVSAIPGVWLIADRLKQRSNEWFDGDPDAGLVSAAVMKRAAKAAGRLPGVRDILIAGHPVVTRLLDELAADRARIPASDDDIVEKLAKLKGFAFDGTIVTIDGVPIPAGVAQTAYFMVLRYAHLYDPQTLPHLVYRRDPEGIGPADYAALSVAEGDRPAHIHLIAYDAANVTDEMQEALLSYSTALHRDTLVALQQSRPALYVAIWRRDMVKARRLACILRVPPLPQPGVGSTRSPAKRLLDGTALMNEFERLFEILDTVKVEGGVTRQSLEQALKACSSMSALQAGNDPAHRFLAGSAAHVRSIHTTMNVKAVKPKTADPILERTRAAFMNGRGFWERTRRIDWIDDTMPGQWFLGIEPAMLVPVALIQMISNMAEREKNFWLRDKHGDAPDATDERRSLVTELAVVITAGICPATARSMLPPDATDKALSEAGTLRSDADWRDAVLPTLIRNPTLADKVEALAYETGIAWPVPGNADCDRPRRSSPYDRAMKRAAKLTKLGRPGWTQGFLFEAWLRPNAELAFLRGCCRYILYDPEQATKRDIWNGALAQRTHPDGQPVIATDIATGLPRQHPLELIQDLFRDPFDRVQVADLANERATPKQRAWRETAIAEVAALIAAVSPITLDPQLAERSWDDLDDDMVSLARDGAWNI